jgi:hypothetical protein
MPTRTLTPPPADPASTEIPVGVTPPGFGLPSHRQPIQDPLDPQRTTTTAEPDVPADNGQAEPSRPPTTPKIGPSQVFSPDPETFEVVIATAVGLASLGVNHRLSPETNTWLADESQAHDIAAPLARIAARHIRLSDQALATDLGDGLEAGIAAVGYVVTSHQRSVQARRQAGGWSDAEQAS